MATFKIIEATKKGFIQTWQDREILLKHVLPAYLVHVLGFYLLSTNLILSVGEETKKLEIEMIHGLPLYASFGLIFVGIILLSYIFVFQSRWVLLNEKEIPKTQKKRKTVLRTYGIAIGIFLLVLIGKEIFNQGAVALSETIQSLGNVYLIAFGLMNMVISIWLLRLSVAHIPLSIDYPLMDFLRKVKGFAFSFYLMGLLITCIVPIAFVSLMGMALVVEMSNLIAEGLVRFTIPVFAAFFYLCGFLVLNNASIFALDEVMKAKDE